MQPTHIKGMLPIHILYNGPQQRRRAGLEEQLLLQKGRVRRELRGVGDAGFVGWIVWESGKHWFRHYQIIPLFLNTLLRSIGMLVIKFSTPYVLHDTERRYFTLYGMAVVRL